MSATVSSERDVVFTPFMLRVRETLTGSAGVDVTLHYELSSTTSIACAVDEWFSLRARAEHVLCEANAMLAPEIERIELVDEFGTGELAFVLRWGGRSYRLHVHQSPTSRTARVEVDQAGAAAALKPVNLDFLEDLTVSLLSPGEPTVDYDEHG